MICSSSLRRSRARLSLVPVVLAAAALAASCSSSTPNAEAPTTTAPAVGIGRPGSTAKATTTTAAGSDDTGDTGDTEPTTTSEAPPDDESTLPAGSEPGLDDLNQDGEGDPTCGRHDFGGGLVLRLPCQKGYESEPPSGSTLAPDSLFGLPSVDTSAFENVSGSAIQARNEDNHRVVVVFFNSDALFQVGSSSLEATDATRISLDATIAFINTVYPGGSIQVRGHTDSTGTDAQNQPLSEARAEAVKTYLTSNGIEATGITSIGFGSKQPATENTNPDGSPNEAGQAFNRRVEIAVTMPS